jgi:hypothetical protein
MTQKENEREPVKEIKATAHHFFASTIMMDLS